MSERLDAILRELRAIYEAHYGPRLVRLILYGSQARGDAEPDSDIDVLVVLRDCGPMTQERTLCRREITDLCLKYDTVIMPIYVSEERYLHSEMPLFRNVRHEGVAV
jgi:predicted nucleotidyltransferase